MRYKSLILLSLIVAAMAVGFLFSNANMGLAGGPTSPNETVVGAPEYNASDEFSLTQGGTTGVWNYGYSTSATDNTLNLFTLNRTTTPCGDNTLRTWYITGEPFDLPGIAGNTGTVPCTIPGFDMLNLHPSNSGRRAVLRWTAPSAGTYLLNGLFQGLDTTTTDVKILKNAATAGETTLFTGDVIGLGSQQPFNLIVTVEALDRLDFSVGFGTGSEEFDSTGLAVSIEPSQLCETAPSGLISWFKAEGNANDVLGINNGTINEATFGLGRVGRAFKFDGVNDDIRFGTTLGNFGTADFGIDFWYETSNNRLESVLSKRACLTSEAGYLDIRKTAAGNLLIEVSNNATNQRADITSVRTLSDGLPHHIALQRQGTTLLLYIDGVVDSSINNIPSIDINNANQLAIGGLGCSGIDATLNFTGKIDELSVYNRALTAAEVAAINSAGGAGKCAVGTPTPTATPTPNPNAPTAMGELNGVISSGQTFTGVRITYTDDVAIDVLTLGNGDVTINGPNGFENVPSSLTSLDNPTNGTPRVATYLLGSPGGSWNAADNGTYNIVMRFNEVADTGGAFVAAGTIGSFTVNLGDPTATPTDTPTATPTNTPTATPTNTPTATPTNTPTATPTNTPTATPTNTPTATPTNTPTATPTNTPTATPTSTPTATPTPVIGRSVSDFDGDGKTDVGIYRPSTGDWWVIYSSNTADGFVLNFGGDPTDIPVQGDYDGDGKADMAIFRKSDRTWWGVSGPLAATPFAFVQQWGEPGDIPVPGDYDRDGKTDVAIYRPSDGGWWVLFSSIERQGGTFERWGIPGDIPVPEDYDGDGQTDFAIYRPSSGTWWLNNSSDGSFRAENLNTIVAGSIPAVGDYDGNGVADIALFIPSVPATPSLSYFAVRTQTQEYYVTMPFGADRPVIGDYDGDNMSDFAAYYPAASQSNWRIRNQGIVLWGMNGDIPLNAPILP